MKCGRAGLSNMYYTISPKTIPIFTLQGGLTPSPSPLILEQQLMPLKTDIIKRKKACTKKTAWISKLRINVIKNYPVLNAIFINPLRFLNFKVADPGYASNDSAAPPMTMMAAFPVPFFVHTYVMLSLDTSFKPKPSRKSR